MKPYAQILLPTGHLYEIPASAIVQSRAAYYHAEHKDEFPTIESAVEDTVELFADTYQVRDWALNNMQAEELMKHARLVRFTPPEVDFGAAEWSHHDAEAMIPQLESQTMLAVPVEMAVAAMAAHRNLCQILTLNADNGQPFAAVVLIQGGPGIVGTYVGALTHLTQAYVQPAAPAAASPH